MPKRNIRNEVETAKISSVLAGNEKTSYLCRPFRGNAYRPLSLGDRAQAASGCGIAVQGSGMVVRRSGNVECETLKFVATMNKDAIIKLVNEQMWPKTDADVPAFKAGDTITVTYKIVEGSKERLQSFRGVVIQIKGQGKTKMFTIRKISNGVGVERIFPLYSPHIEKIEVNKIGVVRRARIYYLRDLTGKKARIKEKRMTRTEK